MSKSKRWDRKHRRFTRSVGSASLGAAPRASGRSSAAPPPSRLPDEVAELVSEATMFQFQGQHEFAVAKYDRALELAPDESALWKNRGVSLKEPGRYEEALVSARRGLELDPSDAGLWNNMGVALRELGRYEQALATFERGLELDPQDALLWQNKGVVLGRYLHRAEEAEECFRRARDLRLADQEPGAKRPVQTEQPRSAAARRAKRPSDSELIAEAVERLIVLYKASPRGEGFVTSTPAAEPVRDVGRRLEEQGGFQLMLKAHQLFAEKYQVRGARRNLEMVWDGIGTWLG